MRVADLVVSLQRPVRRDAFDFPESRNNWPAGRADVLFIHQAMRINRRFQTIQVSDEERNEFRIKVSPGFFAQHFDCQIARQAWPKGTLFAD